MCRKTILYIIVAMIVLAIFLSVIFKLEAMIKRPGSLDILIHDVDRVHQALKPGTTSGYLNYQLYLQYGYADCRGFATVLKQMLSNNGLTSRIVGLVSKDGNSHNLLEVWIHHRWVLVDPMSDVVYKDGFLNILMNPDLVSRQTKLAVVPQDIKVLSSKNFFANAREVDLGSFSLSDRYRFVPFPRNNKTNYETNRTVFTCNKSQCNWRIPITDHLRHDEIFEKLPLITVKKEGYNVRVFYEKNIPIKTSLLYRLSSAVVNKKHYFVLSSRGAPPYNLYLYTVVSSADTMSEVSLRIPLYSVLVFNQGDINFYGASLVCNGKTVWQKKLKSTAFNNLSRQNFYNAFFLPDDPHLASAWSLPKKGLEDNIYRAAVMNLSSNLPRIRLQPLAMGAKKINCSLRIEYTSKKGVQLQIYATNNKAYNLARLPACAEGVICDQSVSFNQKVTNLLFVRN